MKKRITRTSTLLLALLFAGATISFAQEKSPSAKDTTSALEPAAAAAVAEPAAESKLTTAAAPQAKSAQPSEAEMMKQMMELGKPGENHKLLSDMAGTWVNWK